MFKKLLQLKTLLVALLVMTGAGNVWADEELYYTLTPANGSNSNYTANCDVKISGITWNIGGNSQLLPWRIGGKNITKVDRAVYSKTPMGSAISKVELEVGAASSITVNSLKLIVASDANFSTQIDEVTATFTASSTIAFTPSSPAVEWATGAYYKFVFNVTVSGSSNKFVEFKSAKFYHQVATLENSDLAITNAPVALNFDLYNNDEAQTVSYTTSSTGAVSVSGGTDYVTTSLDLNTKTITVTPKAVTPSAQTITISQEADATYKAGSVTFTVNIVDSTPVPTHTATFSVNGVTSTQDFEEGASISFPEDPVDINGKTFVGWVTEAIAGTTDTAPTYVTEATMGNADVTYYALFAEESIGQGPVEKYLTITPSDFTSLTNFYTETSTTKTVEGKDYTIAIQACLQGSQIQMRDNATISFIYFPPLPGNVKNVSTTTCHNASDEAYTGTIRLKSSKTRGNVDTNDIVKAVLSSVNSFSIDVTGNVTSFYFVTSAGLRLGNLTVTYEGIGDVTIYSGYCTTVPEDVRTPVNLTGFSATPSTIVRGDVLQTTVTNDQSGWDASYTYSSDNTSVATVDDNGTITAVGRGTANISVALNVDKNDTQYKRGETSNATIEITVVNPSHTATFYNDGMVVSSLSVQEKDDIEFPSDQTAEGYAFIGWTTSEIDEPQSTQPELTNSAVMGTSDMNFYAVFARLSETEGWRKIGGLQTLAAGTYAIITADGYAFNGTISSGHGQSTNEAFSFTDSVATSAPTGTCLIELIKVDGGFKLYNPTTEKYLYAEKASSGNLAWHSTENSFWEAKEVNIIYNANGAYLRVFNKTFRTYAGSSNAPLYFAMKTTIPSYSNYCTTIPTLTISLNAACHDGGRVYGTYSSSHPFVVSDDIVVSEISIENDAFHVKAYETGAVVPANTGVMVSAPKGGDYTVNVAATEGASVLDAANCLRPPGDDGITAEAMGNADTGCLFYRLTMHNGEQIGYWWGAENGAAFAVAANKAYMAIPEAQAARMMGNGFSEIFTGIVSTEQQRESVATYNLLGQRVSPDTKGVLIRNGKKLINK